jgi:hypothetical protein
MLKWGGREREREKERLVQANIIPTLRETDLEKPGNCALCDHHRKWPFLQKYLLCLNDTGRIYLR